MNIDLLYRYLRFWYLFVAFTLLFLGAAFAYLRYATPEYSISSSVLIKDDNNEKLFEGDVFDRKSEKDSKKNIDDEIEFFKSYNMMQRVMEGLYMQTSFYTKGRLKNIELYGEEVPINIIVSRIDYKKVNTASIYRVEHLDEGKFNLVDSNKVITYKYGQRINRPNVAFAVFKKSSFSQFPSQLIFKFNNLPKLSKNYVNLRMQVLPISKTGNALSISLTEPLKERGVDIVDRLIATYNIEGVEYKNKSASNALNFIGNRLNSLTAELSGVEKNVEVYKQQNKITDVTSNAQSYVQNAGDYGKQLSESEMQINILNAVEGYFKNQSNQNATIPSTLGISDPALTGLISQFSNLQMEKQRQLRIIQPSNPIILGLDEQIASLRERIFESLKTIKSTLVISRNNLRATSNRFESKIHAVPSIQRDLLEIQRQQGIKESLYLYLLQKREESALSLASTVSNARVIDSAVANDVPTKPKKQLAYLIALILGLGLPFGLLYLRDSIANKVQSIDDIKKNTDIKILGEISHNPSKQTLVVQKGSTTTISELFRLIRTNLRFVNQENSEKVCLVSSCNSGDGKSFFVINLGASLALTNKKVVLLEFDLRKPELLSKINVNAVTGLSDYLKNPKLTVEDLVLPSTVDPNLFVIGAGAIPHNPSEIFVESRLKELISELKNKFDYILIDTSPIGKVADAYALAPFVDSSIFIVRYNHTAVEQLGILNDLAQNERFKNPFIVANDARRGNSQGFSYGYNSK